MAILMIDDDVDMRKSVIEYLAMKGYEVEGAASAEEALQMLKENEYDLAILDLVMEPGIGGEGFLKEYPKVTPDLQVIVLTGYPSVDTAVTALRGGAKARAVEYLQKPIHMSQLKETVDRAMTSLRAQGFHVDLRTKTAYYRDKPFHLTDVQFRTLVHLLRHLEQSFTYPDLVWAIFREKMDVESATVRMKTQLWRLQNILRQQAGYEVIQSQAGRGFSISKAPPPNIEDET